MTTRDRIEQFYKNNTSTINSTEIEETLFDSYDKFLNNKLSIAQNNNIENESTKLFIQLNDMAYIISFSPIGDKEKYIKNIYFFEGIFVKLINQSIIDNFVWDFCPSQVYVNNYERLKGVFLEKNIDANEIDFIKEELLYFDYLYRDFDIADLLEIDLNYGLKKQKDITFNCFISGLSLGYPFDGEIKKQIEYSYNAKLNFLKTKLNLFTTTNENNSQIITEPYIEISEETKKNISKSFVYLHELGIIDYLKNLDGIKTNENKLAFVLSKIMNEDQKTLQSYINAITNGNRNNPLKDKTIIKVHEILITNGFNPKLFKSNNTNQ